jgi:hypothetical protein
MSIQEAMSGRWSSARTFLNQNADEAFARWVDWYTRRRYVGKLPQVVFYLLCVGIAWWVGGPRLAVILVFISLAVVVAIFGIGLVVGSVLMWRRRRP